MACVGHTVEAFDRNKDGSASKKRLHKGNIPTLPQNKLCPHCPAKFTRSTHLNRHLRTHLNQKFHECERCHAQFTRRDLLSRHQKSCVSSGIRTRRKSCLPCAESKQKCDTGRPCTRCGTRGRDCIYVTDLEALPGASQIDPDSETLATRFPRLSICEPNLFLSRTSSTDSSPLQLTSNTSSRHTGGYEGGLSNEVFDTFLNNIFASASSSTLPQNQLLLPNEPSTGNPETDPQDGFPYFVTDIDLQPFLASTITESFSDLPMYTNIYPTASIDTPSPEQVALSGPSETESSYYLYLFFSGFLRQMPLVHPPTWTIDDKPPILISAMQACGALYVKTPSATDFINSTLASARDTLIGEFARRPTDPNEQVHLIMAVVLLQTIGLFHQNREQRASSSIYHGMLIMMIRKTALMFKVNAWTPPNLAKLSPDELELAWKEWATMETAKRALCLSYLHDCCHCIFFALPPSLQPYEFNLPLPCETMLWQARSAQEWMLALADKQSPHRTNTWNRLKGITLHEVLIPLKSPTPNPNPYVLSSLAHFIIIHAITTKVNNLGLLSPQGCTPSRIETSDGMPADTARINEIKATIVELQWSLHNWLQCWLVCPEASAQTSEDTPFMSNALPFYWVSQVSLLAYQKGLPPFTPAFTMKGEEKLKLTKEWLRHIRAFLRKGEQSATIFMDELVKIQMRNLQAENDDGLLGFFA